MVKSNKSTGTASRKKAPWIDPDDAPSLTHDFFARATLNKSGKPVRGRPKIANPKMSVSIRLDQEVVSAFKSKGEGWQTAINTSLRKAAGLALLQTSAKRSREVIKPPTRKELFDASKEMRKGHSSGGRVMADQSVAKRQGVAKKGKSKR